MTQGDDEKVAFGELAAFLGRTETVELLLERGAEVNAHGNGSDRIFPGQRFREIE